MITQARSKRHMPMTSVPLTLLPVSTTDDRETARRLVGEYLNWISDIAGQQYRLSFDIDAMLRSDLNDATKFYPPHGRFYLVQSRDGAIGVGALKRLAVEVGEIQRMYVQPSARGLGAGRLLVQRLLDDARALGLRRVRLESLKAFAAACTVPIGGLRRDSPLRRQQHAGLPIAHSPATLPRQRGVYGDRAFL